jgi:hypothetical protein
MVVKESLNRIYPQQYFLVHKCGTTYFVEEKLRIIAIVTQISPPFVYHSVTKGITCFTIFDESCALPSSMNHVLCL